MLSDSKLTQIHFSPFSTVWLYLHIAQMLAIFALTLRCRQMTTAIALPLAHVHGITGIPPVLVCPSSIISFGTNDNLVQPGRPRAGGQGGDHPPYFSSRGPGGSATLHFV